MDEKQNDARREGPLEALVGRAEAVMKRCQIGVGGGRALHAAHDIMAECYGVIGALLHERTASKDLAAIIHYPDHWDDVAYPTPESAIREALFAVGCSECKTENMDAHKLAKTSNDHAIGPANPRLKVVDFRYCDHCLPNKRGYTCFKETCPHDVTPNAQLKPRAAGGGEVGLKR